MIRMQQDEGDFAEYLALVERLVRGILNGSGIERVYVTKIDKWFPAKWCEFSGEVHGMLGVWKEELTLPPFVPSRVVAQGYYEFDAVSRTYRQKPTAKQVHRSQPSSDNLKRFVDRFDGGAAFFWYCGSTATTGRGCLMGYIPIESAYKAWYAEFDTTGECSIGLLRGVSRSELERYAEA